MASCHGVCTGLIKESFSDETILIPDYAHASREASKLKLKIKSQIISKDGLELAFDSTGVNVYSRSGYHRAKYGEENLCHQSKQWKKIHLALDLDSMQIISMVYTDSNVNDCEVVEELCQPVRSKINSVRADSAYDTEKIHKIIYAFRAKALIPPPIRSKAQDELKNRSKHLKEHLKQRDSIIKFIRGYDNFEEGLKEWKKESGYHRRSLIEACMFRFKKIFGYNLQHKNENSRKNEIIIKINLLNQMAGLGKAQYS